MCENCKNVWRIVDTHKTSTNYSSQSGKLTCEDSFA